jgi:hypothetical protein
MHDSPESRVNQVWHVQIRGERALRTVKVAAETDKTIYLFNTDRMSKGERFKVADVEFVERQAR